MQRSGWSVNRTRKTLMFVGAMMSPIGIAAVFVQSLFWTITFICVAIFFWMAWSVTVQTLPGDFFPARTVASVYGIGGTGSTIGSVISIWLVGRILDTTHEYVGVSLYTRPRPVMPLAYRRDTLKEKSPGPGAGTRGRADHESQGPLRFRVEQHLQGLLLRAETKALAPLRERELG